MKDKLRRKAEQLIQMLDLNAPDNVLALSVRLLIDTATADFGEELYREIGKGAAANARQRHGLCQSCDAEIAAYVTHPPLCEHCDAKQSAEADRMQEQADKWEQEDTEKARRLLREIYGDDHSTGESS